MPRPFIRHDEMNIAMAWSFFLCEPSGARLTKT